MWGVSARVSSQWCFPSLCQGSLLKPFNREVGVLLLPRNASDHVHPVSRKDVLAGTARYPDAVLHRGVEEDPEIAALLAEINASELGSGGGGSYETSAAVTSGMSEEEAKAAAAEAAARKALAKKLRQIEGRKRGPKMRQGPHLTDHVKALMVGAVGSTTAAASYSREMKSESQRQYAYSSEMREAIATHDATHLLKKNKFSEHAEQTLVSTG
jgi:hypothetical protein